MSTLILICGLPGSGKSTLARIISEKLGGHFLDIDEFKREVVDPNLVKSEIDPPEVRWLYYEKSVSAALGLFESGSHFVVLEEVFHLQSLRHRIDKMCEDLGIQIIWIEVVCPYETVRERLLKKSREGHILSTDEALIMYQKFSEIFDHIVCGTGKFSIDNSNGDLHDSADSIVRELSMVV